MTLNDSYPNFKDNSPYVERATAMAEYPPGGTMSVFKERSHYARIRAFAPLRCALGVKGPLATTNDAHIYIFIVAAHPSCQCRQRAVCYGRPME